MLSKVRSTATMCATQVLTCSAVSIGHRQAYLAGIIHRDVSTGNVMMERKADGTVGGFIHDLDYAFSWRRFLADANLPVHLETWERYVREEYRRVTQKREMDGGGYESDRTRGDESDSGFSSSREESSSDSSANIDAALAASEFHVDEALKREQKNQTVRRIRHYPAR